MPSKNNNEEKIEARNRDRRGRAGEKREMKDKIYQYAINSDSQLEVFECAN